jgi:hypothetical protein
VTLLLATRGYLRRKDGQMLQQATWGARAALDKGRRPKEKMDKNEKCQSMKKSYGKPKETGTLVQLSGIIYEKEVITYNNSWARVLHPPDWTDRATKITNTMLCGLLTRRILLLLPSPHGKNIPDGCLTGSSHLDMKIQDLLHQASKMQCNKKYNADCSSTTQDAVRQQT